MPKRLRIASSPKRARVGQGGQSRLTARRTKAKQPSALAIAAKDRPIITIRAYIGKRLLETAIGPSRALLRVAEEWTYILRSRQRWVDKDEVRWSLRDRALADLQRIGISPRFVERLVSARDSGQEADLQHVEVELHANEGNDTNGSRLHEAASEFPWEYLISAATRGVGRHRPILITRLFRSESHSGGKVSPERVPERILFVESAPGRLEGTYDFKSERARVQAALGAEEDPDEATTTTRRTSIPCKTADRSEPRRKITFSATDDIRDLKTKVQTGRFDIIHVTGIDTHQANLLADTLYDELKKKKSVWRRIADEDDRVSDGMVLRMPKVAELPVNYEDLARILVDPEHPPDLVSLNCYHSGARTARELVRRGAGAALGFLDEIDDELAELFFQAFYWALCEPESLIGSAPPADKSGLHGIPRAFLEAWNQMEKQEDRLHGTAIVLWTSRTSVQQWPSEAVARSRKRAADAAAKTSPSMAKSRLSDIPVKELLQVECVAASEINYSLLHNQRPLLSKLTLTKLVQDTLYDVTVAVELNLGAQNYPYRSTCLSLEEPQVALAPLIQIPLTAALPRALRERVQSTVYVKVKLGSRTAYEDTKRVTLIPVDEWLDDTENNPWLPSFVLPRDPAILRIVQSARRYLIGILDDPAAGFDGYQSVDEKAADPYSGVDAQVRALWTALVNEYRFQYINPPPAYSEQTQRLRTPSDILESNSGTCIDLALLLASCLEYVDIYPVVVLLDGHAFAGYWRSEEAHNDFVGVQRVPARVPGAGDPAARKAGVPFVGKYGWRLTRLQYEEILEHVAAGELSLLEATYLTSASRFAEALEEGRANMRSRREFDSLLDIRLARSAIPPVTPLPIMRS